MDRYTFLSKNQKSNESLHQFWNILIGSPAKSHLRDQRQGLVYSILNLELTVSFGIKREKLFTEPK